MAKKKRARRPVAATTSPKIYVAVLGPNGAVTKGQAITQAQAEARRKVGQDIVVCGPNLAENRNLAKTIESNANGNYKLCPPHANAGPLALPHFQPDPRPPAGHSFYETPNRHAT